VAHPGGSKKKPLWGTCIGIYSVQYFDSETGLHYNWNRYYDPSLGRYLRADPSHSNLPDEFFNARLFFFLYSPQEFNVFAYVENNPVNNIDPTGLLTGWIFGGGTAGAHWWSIGGNYSVYTGVSTRGEVCSFTTHCIRVGFGIYAGISAVVGAGVSGSKCDCGKNMGGLSVGIGADVAAPGGGGGGSIGISGCSVAGIGGAARMGAGLGLSAGVDICFTKVNGCINSPPCCNKK
jgi:RHS repeat-associated protein